MCCSGPGLLARNAGAPGAATCRRFVKTSLAPRGPGSSPRYLAAAGVMPYLESPGVFIRPGSDVPPVSANSGPAAPGHRTGRAGKTTSPWAAVPFRATVNFEARIHQLVKSNFLASPMLVVAFALAGRIDTDLYAETGGDRSQRGAGVHERHMARPPGDHRPGQCPCQTGILQGGIRPDFSTADEFWQGLPVTESTTYAWDENIHIHQKTPPISKIFPRMPVCRRISPGQRFLLVSGRLP